MRRPLAGLAALTLFFNCTTLWACPECRIQVESGIYNQDFVNNLFITLLPVIVLASVVCGIYFAENIKAKLQRGADRWLKSHDARL